MITIGNRLEVFFDDYIVDTERSTAKTKLWQPVRRGAAIVCDEAWEGNACGYPNIFYAEGKWYMYYRASAYVGGTSYFCRAESVDGITFTKPKFGIVEINGSSENNAFLDKAMVEALGAKHMNDFYAFYDENPACPAEERYKAVMSTAGDETLISLVSPDGLHFTRLGVMTDYGAFDSQNLAFYSKEYGRYFCYYRHHHKPDPTVSFDEYSFKQATADKLWDWDTMSTREPGPEDEDAKAMRDIRVMESFDFIHWTENKLIGLKDDKFQLYTNTVLPYPRAPHIFVGTPMRYNERKAWTPNYDELCGRDARMERIVKGYARAGLVVTDAIFMCTRDGYNFTRYDEAFMRPPVENPHSWMYGDCYAAAGLVETPSDIPGADNEYSFYVIENYRAQGGKEVFARYTVRLDGFVSKHAEAEEELLVTKELIYDGKNLYANLATSARGHAYFTLKCEGEEYCSYEIFGNSVNKKVSFRDPEAVARLSGKPVTLEVRLSDADLYSIRFGE